MLSRGVYPHHHSPFSTSAELVINATGAGTLSRAPALYFRAPTH